MHQDKQGGQRKPISRRRPLPTDLKSLPPYLSVSDAAFLTSTSDEFWRKRILKRRIPYIKIGSKSIRIPTGAVLKLIKVVPPIVDDAELED